MCITRQPIASRCGPLTLCPYNPVSQTGTPAGRLTLVSPLLHYSNYSPINQMSRATPYSKAFHQSRPPASEPAFYTIALVDSPSAAR